MSQVYFLYAPTVNLIKIGTSADPERRLEEVRLISPVPLHVIGVIAGNRQTEAELHAKFADIRSHGEWFFATDALRKFAWRESFRDLWERGTSEEIEWAREFIDKPIMDRRHG